MPSRLGIHGWKVLMMQAELFRWNRVWSARVRERDPGVRLFIPFPPHAVSGFTTSLVPGRSMGRRDVKAKTDTKAKISPWCEVKS
jgi:hypothetical protein